MKRPVFKIENETYWKARLLVLTVSLEWSAEPESDLKVRIEQAVQEGVRNVLIDVAGIERFDSAAIGQLIRAHAPLRQRAGEMHLCGVGSELGELLRITRLETVFVIHTHREKAIEELLDDEPLRQ